MIRSMPEDFGKEVRHASCIRMYIYQESESNEGNTWNSNNGYAGGFHR